MGNLSHLPEWTSNWSASDRWRVPNCGLGFKFKAAATQLRPRQPVLSCGAGPVSGRGDTSAPGLTVVRNFGLMQNSEPRRH